MCAVEVKVCSIDLCFVSPPDIQSGCDLAKTDIFVSQRMFRVTNVQKFVKVYGDYCNAFHIH